MNLNASFPWLVVEPHAMQYCVAHGRTRLAPHHTAVARFPTEAEAVADLTRRNALDERLARLGRSNQGRNSKRYVAYSAMTYDDIMSLHRERQKIEQLVNSVLAMTAIAA